MKEIEIVYPSFTKKAVSFTIDDGNFTYDEKMISILKPAGIVGTFNLCSQLHLGKEEYTREFYSGFGIANHCKHHPLASLDGVEYIPTDAPYVEGEADPKYIYPADGKAGFYWVHYVNRWRMMVFTEDYVSFVSEGKDELEEIFGEGSVKDFVWPYREMDNARIKEHVRNIHRSARRTGCTLDTTGFSIPKDKYSWSYNADDSNLLEVMSKYEAYPDDGELKFFAFGVHSIDFETHGTWGNLESFARKYGSRPDTYWYASVSDIFDYEEAVGRLTVTDTEIKNCAEQKIYLLIDKERVTILPGETINV